MLKRKIIKNGCLVFLIFMSIAIIFACGHEKIFADSGDDSETNLIDGAVNLSLWKLELDKNGTSGTLDYEPDDNIKNVVIPNAADFILSNPERYKNLTRIYITKEVMQKALFNANKEDGTLKISDTGSGDQQKVFAQGEDWRLITSMTDEDLRWISKIDFSNFDTSDVTNMVGMFKGCSNLTSLILGEDFDTSKVTNMAGMFSMCTNLIRLNLGSHFDTHNVTNMAQMFNCCKSLTSLTLSENFNTSQVHNMYSMFAGCESLEVLIFGENFNTSNVEDMSCMFAECKRLTDLIFGENFNTSKVENMCAMFKRCSALKELFFGENFDTSKVTNMQHMFGNCRTLKTLDLSLFNTENVKHMENMFRDCANLATLVLGHNFTTSNLEFPPAFIFNGCVSLEEIRLIFDNNNISNENTSNIAALCAALTLKESPGKPQQVNHLKILKGYKKGFTFENWYSDKELTEVFDFENNSDFTVNDVLYAKWTKSDKLVKIKKHIESVLDNMLDGNKKNLLVIKRIKEKLLDWQI